MTVAAMLGTLPGHAHWCPRCESTWTCTHGMPDCPLGGGVVADQHCTWNAYEDDDD